MARYLALDSDSTRFQLISATVRGETVRLEKALSWQEEQPLTASNAAAAGERFKARLKDAGITPAALVVGLARERVILKDIKIPPLAPHEEPAAVRFQAMRELSEGGEDAVLDYVPAAQGVGNDRRVLVGAIRKDALAAYKKFAESAGLKIVSMTGRTFAVLAGMQRAIASGDAPPVEPATAGAALLVRGDTWGEFIISHQGRVSITRSLAGPTISSDAALLGELRRNLAVHANQHPEAPVRALYIAEADTPGGLRERLQQALAIPVHAYEPAVGVPTPDARPGALAGAAGLLALQAMGSSTLNFVEPRKPKPPSDPFRRVLALVSVACLAVIMGVAGFSYMKVSAKQREMVELGRKVTDTRKLVNDLAKDAKKIKALDEWSRSEINWLDEMFDLTARMKDTKSVRVTSITASPLDDRTGKAKHVATMTIKGITKNDLAPLNNVMAEIIADPGYQVHPKQTKENKVFTTDRRDFPIEYSTKLELEHRSPDRYTRTFKAEVPPKRTTQPGGGFGPGRFGAPGGRNGPAPMPGRIGGFEP